VPSPTQPYIKKPPQNFTFETASFYLGIQIAEFVRLNSLKFSHCLESVPKLFESVRRFLGSIPKLLEFFSKFLEDYYDFLEDFHHFLEDFYYFFEDLYDFF
jgi:hypothetical protein